MSSIFALSLVKILTNHHASHDARAQLKPTKNASDFCLVFSSFAVILAVG
jgi:hypothetical protein